MDIVKVPGGYEYSSTESGRTYLYADSIFDREQRRVQLPKSPWFPEEVKEWEMNFEDILSAMLSNDSLCLHTLLTGYGESGLADNKRVLLEYDIQQLKQLEKGESDPFFGEVPLRPFAVCKDGDRQNILGVSFINLEGQMVERYQDSAINQGAAHEFTSWIDNYSVDVKSDGYEFLLPIIFNEYKKHPRMGAINGFLPNGYFKQRDGRAENLFYLNPLSSSSILLAAYVGAIMKFKNPDIVSLFGKTQPSKMFGDTQGEIVNLKLKALQTLQTMHEDSTTFAGVSPSLIDESLRGEEIDNEDYKMTKTIMSEMESKGFVKSSRGVSTISLAPEFDPEDVEDSLRPIATSIYKILSKYDGDAMLSHELIDRLMEDGSTQDRQSIQNILSLLTLKEDGVIRSMQVIDDGVDYNYAEIFYSITDEGRECLDIIRRIQVDPYSYCGFHSTDFYDLASRITDEGEMSLMELARYQWEAGCIEEETGASPIVVALRGAIDAAYPPRGIA